jgi:hypothetical protein
MTAYEPILLELCWGSIAQAAVRTLLSVLPAIGGEHDPRFRHGSVARFESRSTGFLCTRWPRRRSSIHTRRYLSHGCRRVNSWTCMASSELPAGRAW